MNQRWKAVCKPKLLWRSWNDEYVVYNDLTGDTHRLDTVPAQILKSLEEAPADEEELGSRLAGMLEIDADENVVKSTRDMIDNFRHRNLIVPTHS